MRISVNLSEEMLKKVDKEAELLGTSRGAMLTAWIGEKISNLEMARNLITNGFQDKLIEALKSVEFEEVKSDKKTKKEKSV